MRPLIRQLALLLTLLLGMAQLQAQSNAFVSADVTDHRVTTAQVNVRACAQTSCPTMTTYPEGTPLFVLGSVTGDAVQGDSIWYRIRDSVTGQEGYVNDRLTAAHSFDDWQLRPVFPAAVSNAMKQVYQEGLANGNDPNAFSKTGDCQNVLPTFLAPFANPANYNLGSFTGLQATIDHFAGSFDRLSAATDDGFNVASVLSPLWADKRVCTGGENPLQCEERLHNPSIAIVNMETWWQQRPATEYEAYLNQIVEFWIAQGVVPIVGTKADNLEGDHGINAAIVRVADRYEIPLWNYWLAVQGLPGHGLTEDGFHLTFARDFYNDPARMANAWPIRNLTALQTLDAVYRALNDEG